MPPSIIILTGAPTSSSLSWDESHLLSDFTEPFIRFLHLSQNTSYPNSAPRHNNNGDTTSLLETAAAPEWRQLPLRRQHLPTGASQGHVYQPIYSGLGPEFFSTTTFVSQSQSQPQPLNHDSYLSTNDHNDYGPEQVDEIVSHFYEHSYAIHADIPSSQLAPHASFTSTSNHDTGTSLSTSQSYSLNDSTSFFPSGGSVKDVHVPVAGYLTNLEDMPHAQYLSSIQPQTMTVNLIVGVISVSEPRAIDTRRGGNVSLVEILVGDETKSGFSINFWLSGKGREEVKRVLESLRVQDIVLIKNVALGSFRGQVHGQSLRKDMTKCWLLYRDKIDRSDVGGCYGKRDLEGKDMDGQLTKVKRVRNWVTQFVGVAAPPKRGVKRVREELPPDTQ